MTACVCSEGWLSDDEVLVLVVGSGELNDKVVDPVVLAVVSSAAVVIVVYVVTPIE